MSDSLMILFSVVLTFLFFCLKLCGFFPWSWVWVFSPIISLGLFIIALVFLFHIFC